LIRGGVFDGLDMIVNGNGDGARGAGKISANHEDDAKFAERVGKRKDDSGDYAGERKRKNDLAERAHRIGTEDVGGGEKFWIEALEGCDEWLDAERKTVEHAGDDEAGESEGERVAEKCEPESAERTARSHGDEKIKAEDGWRKNERESYDGFDEEFRGKFGKG